jgi:hypothetical protein
VVIENFLGVDKCEQLKGECERIIDSNNFVEEINKISVFDANEGDEGNARVCFFVIVVVVETPII